MEAPGFVSDIYLPQMLYALAVRSPIAKGRLISIESPELPESCTLIKAQDVPGENRLWGCALPILAGGELSYIGEPVALLLGPDKDLLESAAESCRVIFEEGEPVFSIGEAAARAQTEAGIIAAKRDIRLGEPEEAFARAASVVKSEYETGIQEHWHSEPCVAVAWIEPPETQNGREEPAAQTPQEETEDKEPEGPKLVVSAATQWPLHVKRSVAGVLGPGVSEVEVRPGATGLHMDGKLWYPSLASCHAALGAWATGRPVRTAYTRKEGFLFAPKRFGAGINIASAFDEKGELIGTEIEASINLGAYGTDAAEMLDQVCLGSLGIYAAKNVRIKGLALRTNVPPQGAFAGFGLAQGLFAMERHVSTIADGRRQDPAQWRREKLPKTGGLPLGLHTKEPIPGARLMDAALGMSDYSRKWASYELLRQKRKEHPAPDDSGQTARPERFETVRGIGIAAGYQGNGLLHPPANGGDYGVELILEKDGSLEIKTGMAGIENGTAWTDIALEILGVEAQNVRISRNPETSPESGPATMSRKATGLTALVEEACLAIRGQRFRDPLPISVRKTAGPLEDAEWNRHFALPGGGGADCAGFLRPGSAAAVVEVEMDPVEYVPRIRGVWLAVDGGRVFRKDKARRALRLSAIQALGWAYREHVSYASGRIPEGAFAAFDIPGASEIPPIGIDFIVASCEEPKGIGDLPFACIPAAYLQAVSQAADWPFASIPLKATDVWHAVTSKKKEGAAT